jgi:hypothetical protein
VAQDVYASVAVASPQGLPPAGTVMLDQLQEARPVASLKRLQQSFIAEAQQPSF